MWYSCILPFYARSFVPLAGKMGSFLFLRACAAPVTHTGHANEASALFDFMRHLQHQRRLLVNGIMAKGLDNVTAKPNLAVQSWSELQGLEQDACNALPEVHKAGLWHGDVEPWASNWASAPASSGQVLVD